MFKFSLSVNYQYLCDRLSACANVDLLLICCIPVMSAPWKLPPETAAECNCVVYSMQTAVFRSAVNYG